MLDLLQEVSLTLQTLVCTYMESPKWCVCKVCGKWEDTSGQVFQMQFKHVCVHACIMSMMCGAHKLFLGLTVTDGLNLKPVQHVE